jgi:NAD(P)-dependent dehydrogenase (short-subunit alcohol dehydrogenase family)
LIGGSAVGVVKDEPRVREARRGLLKNKVAIVTGAARGLGEGIVRRFAEEGAVVICADVLDSKPVAESLPPSDGRPSSAVYLDVTDSAAVDALVARVAKEYGRLDIFVNNAGIAQPITELIDTADETIDRVFAVNVRGVIAGTRAAGRVMRGQNGGRIINTASQVGKRAWPGWGIYSASKAAVIAITQVAALELAPYRVTVNCICPGTMVTDMMRTGFKATADQSRQDPEKLIKAHAESIPLGRMGTPSDIGAMAAWIASDDAAFTTGAAFNLTGGEAVFF